MINEDFEEHANKGVSFFYQNSLPFGGQEEGTITWLINIIKEHDFLLTSLTYIFCTDDQLYEINLKHLNHDTYTDIITFDYSNESHELEADIYVSVERVQENAKKYGKSFDEELHRVLIHGVLHLIGYGDKSEEDKKRMREKENACLSLR